MSKLQSLLFAALLGASSVAMADMKIAIVDYRAALSQTNDYKNALESMKKQTGPEQEKIKGLETSLKTMMEKQQKDAAVLSQAEAAKLAKDIEDKKMEYQFIGQKLQKTGQEAEQETLKKLVPKFQDAVKEVADAEGYDIVLEKGATHYSKGSVEITDKVVQRINAKK